MPGGHTGVRPDGSTVNCCSNQCILELGASKRDWGSGCEQCRAHEGGGKCPSCGQLKCKHCALYGVTRTFPDDKSLETHLGMAISAEDRRRQKLKVLAEADSRQRELDHAREQAEALREMTMADKMNGGMAGISMHISKELAAGISKNIGEQLTKGMGALYSERSDRIIQQHGKQDDRAAARQAALLAAREHAAGGAGTQADGQKLQAFLRVLEINDQVVFFAFVCVCVCV